MLSVVEVAETALAVSSLVAESVVLSVLEAGSVVLSVVEVAETALAVLSLVAGSVVLSVL